MKRLFLLLTYAIVLTSCLHSSKTEAPERQGGWDAENPLYGDVESVEIISYDLMQMFGVDVHRRLCNLDTYHFNEAGDVVESYHYTYFSNRDYDYWTKQILTYDSEGNMTEEIEYNKTDWGEDFKPYWKRSYKHDTKANITEETYHHYHDNSDTYLRRIYEFDNNGKRIEEATYDLDDSLLWRYTFNYDSRGNLTEKALYNRSDNEPDSKYTYVYDENDHKTESYYVTSSELTNTYIYDSDGKMIEEIEYVDSSFNRLYKYKYDSHGNRIEKVTYVNENPIPFVHTEYRITYRK